MTLATVPAVARASSRAPLWRRLDAWPRGQQAHGVRGEGEVVQEGRLGAERLEVAVPPEARP